MEYEIKVESVAEQSVAVVSRRVAIPEIGKFIGEAFGMVMAALAAQHVTPSGLPFARYTMHGKVFDVSAGFPIAQSMTSAGEVQVTTLPAGSAATTMHIGGYGDVSKAYEAIMKWIPEHGMTVAGDPWETYLDGPEVAQPRTILRVPCVSAG